jgi:hypothetical protein
MQGQEAKMTQSIRWALLGAVFSLGFQGCSCGGDVGSEDAGAAPPADAGEAASDAGDPVDAGPSPDAGPAPDSGPIPDAGIQVDSGSTPDPDGGDPADSGLQSDAGAVDPDAGGSSAVDGGGPSNDGGSAPGDGGTSPDGGLVMNPAAYFINAPNWGQYVVKGDLNNPTPNAALCDPDNAGMGCTDCLNGGAIRAFSLPDESACTNLTGSDSLGALTWTCHESGGEVTFFSTGFADDKSMADLVLPTGDGWRPNSLTVNNGSVDVFTSPMAAWWDNPVKEASAGVTAGAAQEGTIYVVTSDSTAAFDTGGTDGIGIVILPGNTLTAMGTTYPIDIRGADHVWVEGTIDATGAPYGLFMEDVRCSDVYNVSTTGGNVGIHLGRASHSNRLDTLSATGANNVGIQISGLSGNSARDNLVLGASANTSGKGFNFSRTERLVGSSITAANNTGMGIDVPYGTDVTLFSIVADGNMAQGIGISGVLELDGVEALNNGGVGFSMWGQNCTVSGVEVSGSSGHGIRLDGPENCTFTDVISRSNNGNGILVDSAQGDGANDNVFSNLTLVENTGHGLALNGGSNSNPVEHNRFSNVVSAQNGDFGISVGAALNTFEGLRLYNNGDDGLSSGSGNNVFIGVLSVANNGPGSTFPSGEGNVLLNATAANNSAAISTDRVGVNISGGGQSVLGQVCSVNHSWGINYITSGSLNTASSVAALNNETNEVKLNSTDVHFTGAVRLGGGQCDVTSSLGLEDMTCAVTGTSNATVATALSSASSFVGKITTDDSVNTSDTNGTRLFDDGVQWDMMENESRVWGMDGSAYPNADHRGPCGAGQTCRIWDFSLASADTVLKGINALPTGNDVLTRIWTLGDEPMNQADCDAAFSGTTFNATPDPNRCESLFLAAAVEILGDAIGDDDGLCESSETCLYSPNIGVYQGHGNLVSAGSFTDGTLTGITLMQYETNGR